MSIFLCVLLKFPMGMRQLTRKFIFPCVYQEKPTWKLNTHKEQESSPLQAFYKEEDVVVCT
jgi:hypothetical protein